MQPEEDKKVETEKSDGDLVLDQIVEKIRESDSILIALSQNPNIDELATAVGLGMFIDKMGKHATAIYSGETPNVLEFLRPEEQFESNTNGLQDFIIAINKDKADHLRYKLDGDYVKVYITPYRTVISESDLEFSHGDYNVDLVLALNVESPSRLDAALSEYGKIMQDATIVNITAGVPGKFGEIEWSDPASSSVAEMAAKLLLAMKDDVQIDKEVTTAILTGIVAATERFSNKKTRSETMSVASLLMSLGADQQLVVENIMKEEKASKSFAVERGGQKEAEKAPEEEKASLSANEGKVLDVKENEKPQETETQTNTETPAEELTSVEESIPTIPTGDVDEAAVSATPELIQSEKPETPNLEGNVGINNNQLNDVLPPVAEGQQPAVQPMVQPEVAKQEVEKQESHSIFEDRAAAEEGLTDVLAPVSPPVMSERGSAVVLPTVNNEVMDKVDQPSEGLAEENNVENVAVPGAPEKDYGSMIDEALSEVEPSGAIFSGSDGGGSSNFGINPAFQAAPGVGEAPDESSVPNLNFGQPVDMSDEMGGGSYIAGSSTGVSDFAGVEQAGNIMDQGSGLPMPNDGNVLPPPPAPPLDFSENELPQTNEEAGPNLPTLSPEIMEQIATVEPEKAEPKQEEENPGAFKIPGV